MVPRLHKRGTSFKGACGYILHDAQKTSRDRVQWSETRNLISQADDAWFEMFATTRDQAELKRQSGHDGRGRKNEKPVLHLSLSWAIGENPTPQHMLETARTALNAIGLGDHQALIAAHNDKDHPHVHMVVNSIHPVTGMTAPLKYTKERLSRWAEAYEREHGIHCDQRIINNEDRQRESNQNEARHVTAEEMMRLTQPASSESQKVQGQASAKTARSPSRHRKRHFATTEVIQRMKRYRAEYDHRHMVERDVTSLRHRQEFAELAEKTKQATAVAQNFVEQKYKPRWRELYAEQRKESLQVMKGCDHVFERAVFVFLNSDRLGGSKKLSLRNKIQMICSPAKLMRAVGNMHARERKHLGQIERAETAERAERAWTHHQPRFDALRERHLAERVVQRSKQAYRARDGISYLRARNELTLEHRHGRPSRSAADGPANENDQAYVDRIRAEMTAFYDRNRRPEHTTRSGPAEPSPVPEPQSKLRSDFDVAASADANATGNRADDIKRQMAEWRSRNQSRDFGREL